MDKRVFIPSCCKVITANHLSLYENYKIFACDTETCNGDIFTLQIKYSDGRNEIYEVRPDNAFVEFIERIDNDIKHHQYAYVFFHNLFHKLNLSSMQLLFAFYYSSIDSILFLALHLGSYF